MTVYTINSINSGSSARRLDSVSLERLSALPQRKAKPKFIGEEVILRIPGIDYTKNTHNAKFLVGTATEGEKVTHDLGNINEETKSENATGGGSDGPSGSGPTEPPSSGASSQITENTTSATKLKEKKMSSASTLWTLGLTTGALVLGSIGISFSPINEDLKKFLHVCAYSLTAFTGILLAALGLTEISDRTSTKKDAKSTNSNEEI